MYFLRFTDNPQEDLERGTSIHASDDGNHQVLDGLCGYYLESDNLEDAIEEVINNEWQFFFVGKPVIFEGEFSPEDNLVPDGNLFYPEKIVKILE